MIIKDGAISPLQPKASITLKSILPSRREDLVASKVKSESGFPDQRGGSRDLSQKSGTV